MNFRDEVKNHDQKWSSIIGETRKCFIILRTMFNEISTGIYFPLN